MSILQCRLIQCWRFVIDSMQCFAGPVVDWRALYEGRQERYEAKLKASAERLKQMTAAESSGKDSRSIQVPTAVNSKSLTPAHVLGETSSWTHQ